MLIKIGLSDIDMLLQRLPNISKNGLGQDPHTYFHVCELLWECDKLMVDLRYKTDDVVEQGALVIYSFGVCQIGGHLLCSQCTQLRAQTIE